MSKTIELVGGPLDGAEIEIVKAEIRIALRTAPMRLMAIYSMNNKSVKYHYKCTTEYKRVRIDLFAEPIYYATDKTTARKYTQWQIVEKFE